MKFRHYVIHGYAFQIEWKQIKTSVNKINNTYSYFKQNLMNYLKSKILHENSN